MNDLDRPDEITEFLKTISSGVSAEISTELETYITDLEVKQPDRPARITTILRTIGSQYPAEIGTSLEEYITALEASQKVMQPDDEHTPPLDPDNPPFWSHQRSIEREHRRRERALKKQNNYQ